MPKKDNGPLYARAYDWDDLLSRSPNTLHRGVDYNGMSYTFAQMLRNHARKRNLQIKIVTKDDYIHYQIIGIAKPSTKKLKQEFFSRLLSIPQDTMYLAPAHQWKRTKQQNPQNDDEDENSHQQRQSKSPNQVPTPTMSRNDANKFPRGHAFGQWVSTQESKEDGLSPTDE